jgi:hypothetical protein
MSNKTVVVNSSVLRSIVNIPPSQWNFLSDSKKDVISFAINKLMEEPNVKIEDHVKNLWVKNCNNHLQNAMTKECVVTFEVSSGLVLEKMIVVKNEKDYISSNMLKFLNELWNIGLEYLGKDAEEFRTTTPMSSFEIGAYLDINQDHYSELIDHVADEMLRDPYYGKEVIIDGFVGLSNMNNCALREIAIDYDVHNDRSTYFTFDFDLYLEDIMPYVVRYKTELEELFSKEGTAESKEKETFVLRGNLKALSHIIRLGLER